MDGSGHGDSWEMRSSSTTWEGVCAMAKLVVNRTEDVTTVADVGEKGSRG